MVLQGGLRPPAAPRRGVPARGSRFQVKVRAPACRSGRGGPRRAESGPAASPLLLYRRRPRRALSHPVLCDVNSSCVNSAGSASERSPGIEGGRFEAQPPVGLSALLGTEPNSVGNSSRVASSRASAGSSSCVAIVASAAQAGSCAPPALLAPDVSSSTDATRRSGRSGSDRSAVRGRSIAPASSIESGDEYWP